jgi:very-short-patch-repair endonuclease
MFTIDDFCCLLEFDGMQHFQKVPLLHQNIGDLKAQQARDIKKSVLALEQGYRLIRIDYMCIKSIGHHIEKAIQFFKNSTQKWYLSSCTLYDHIQQALEASETKQTLYKIGI